MITLEQAKNLSYGQTLYHKINRNADGTPQRWKVNGKVKTWKRDSSRVRIPVKHGLRSFDYLEQDSIGCVALHEHEAYNDSEREQMFKTFIKRHKDEIDIYIGVHYNNDSPSDSERELLIRNDKGLNDLALSKGLVIDHVVY